MKSRKLKLFLLAILFTSSIGVFAQAVKEEKKKSIGNGNGAAMENNLNEPNSINPAKNNHQSYEKGDAKIKTSHPENSTGNTYNRKTYDNKKKETK